MHVHELTGEGTRVMRACGNDVIAAHAVSSVNGKNDCSNVGCLKCTHLCLVNAIINYKTLLTTSI